MIRPKNSRTIKSRTKKLAQSKTIAAKPSLPDFLTRSHEKNIISAPAINANKANLIAAAVKDNKIMNNLFRYLIIYKNLSTLTINSYDGY
jgi:hypothetical protein